MDALPSCIDRELWDAFCDMRKTIGKKVPFTPYAKVLILNDLLRFKSEGYDPNDSLKQSIMKGWRGVFPGQLLSVTKASIDPALQKIAQDSKKASPCPPELKAKLDALKRGVVL